jgi:hypothetical protein
VFPKQEQNPSGIVSIYQTYQISFRP